MDNESLKGSLIMDAEDAEKSNREASKSDGCDWVNDRGKNLESDTVTHSGPNSILSPPHCSS